ncbi:hypothetical protein SS50377_27833 [Spironucleus salmonicida]|uniref:Uncharacterized protein n=2 Tax=Spironucleus salmonicida TaxID=348837 RepID=A0A9P8LKJ9_9EUKA|nr:hypothetical protein SS50377_27833 [Spironucleus salmonicida]
MAHRGGPGGELRDVVAQLALLGAQGVLLRLQGRHRLAEVYDLRPQQLGAREPREGGVRVEDDGPPWSEHSERTSNGPGPAPARPPAVPSGRQRAAPALRLRRDREGAGGSAGRALRRGVLPRAHRRRGHSGAAGGQPRAAGHPALGAPLPLPAGPRAGRCDPPRRGGAGLQLRGPLRLHRVLTGRRLLTRAGAETRPLKPWVRSECCQVYVFTPPTFLAVSHMVGQTTSSNQNEGTAAEDRPATPPVLAPLCTPRAQKAAKAFADALYPALSLRPKALGAREDLLLSARSPEPSFVRQVSRSLLMVEVSESTCSEVTEDSRMFREQIAVAVAELLGLHQVVAGIEAKMERQQAQLRAMGERYAVQRQRATDLRRAREALLLRARRK